MVEYPNHSVIPVSLGPRSYPVVIGPGVRRLFSPYFASTGGRRAFWVTDENVAQHWQAELEALKDPAAELIILPPGETSKRLSTIENLCRRLISLGVERGDALVACGGGVIGDMVGFAASVYLRGLAFIQIPTTLLAMVDASVGGKTGVDLPEGKNLVGTFHQPAFVLADVDFLGTLPPREITSGFAEVVKTAIIGDEELFAYINKSADQGCEIFNNSPYFVEQCVKYKSQVVADDETEKGRRAILNFGHTLGHALEVLGGYQTLKHGEAVFWGMAAAIDLSVNMGLLETPSARQIKAILQPHLNSLPRLKFTPNQILELIYRDKKVRGGRPRFVLLEGIARPVISENVPEDQLIAILENLQRQMENSGDDRG